MPPEMATKEAGKKEISMRHSKLKASEAAILMGELKKPSWESRNEGIHERVSFEDSIWGFDLAGGIYYNTPLRVTAVKKESRAEKAGIRPGDRLLRINDIDTSTLTIQEAHEIIIESGVHLRIAVTAPEDMEDSYHCWEDPLEQDGYDSEEERRKERIRNRKPFTHAKVSSYWSLQWPWVSKRRVIYRESNCFMVPSKYENHHRDKFPEETTFGPKVLDDIVLHSKDNDQMQTPTEEKKVEQLNGTLEANEIQGNLEADSENTITDEEVIEESVSSTNITSDGVEERLTDEKETEDSSEAVDDRSAQEDNSEAVEDRSAQEDSSEAVEEKSAQEDSVSNEKSDIQENSEGNDEKNIQENGVETEEQKEVSVMDDDDVINKVLDKNASLREDDEKIFNDILNDSDANTDAETIDENKR